MRKRREAQRTGEFDHTKQPLAQSMRETQERMIWDIFNLSFTGTPQTGAAEKARQEQETARQKLEQQQRIWDQRLEMEHERYKQCLWDSKHYTYTGRERSDEELRWTIKKLAKEFLKKVEEKRAEHRSLKKDPIFTYEGDSKVTIVKNKYLAPGTLIAMDSTGEAYPWSYSGTTTDPSDPIIGAAGKVVDSTASGNISYYVYTDPDVCWNVQGGAWRELFPDFPKGVELEGSEDYDTGSYILKARVWDKVARTGVRVSTRVSPSMRQEYSDLFYARMPYLKEVFFQALDGRILSLPEEAPAPAPPRKKWGKAVFYGGKDLEMNGYSMGEYNPYEVAAIELPSKEGDFKGEGAKVLHFKTKIEMPQEDGSIKVQTQHERVCFQVAPNEDAAIVRATKDIVEDYDPNRLKVFVRPFVVS